MASKTMVARFAGKCECCHKPFPAGATIVWDGPGRASHVECIAAEAKRFVDQDAADSAAQDKFAAEFRAGKRIRMTESGGELFVSGAPSYEMAREEAQSFCCSVRAAGGSARLAIKRVNGKKFVGREVRSGGYSGTMTYHEGWAFRYIVA